MSARSTSRATASAGSAFRFEDMTRTHRVMAAVRGEPVHRFPVGFRHHFRPEGSGRKMAEASLLFFDETFDLDILKVMPDIPYPFGRKSIQQPNVWRLIEPIDASRSRFFQQRAECVQLLRDEL